MHLDTQQLVTQTFSCLGNLVDAWLLSMFVGYSLETTVCTRTVVFHHKLVHIIRLTSTMTILV